MVLAIFAAAFFAFDTDMYSGFLIRFSYKKQAWAGKVVWITGGSSGIGAQLAGELVREGAQVILSARREAELEAVAASCIGKLKPFVLPLDVLDYDAQAKAYAQVIEKFGRIDSLVLNAGRSQRSLAEDFPLSGTKEIFELNVFSTINLAKLALPHMIERRSGQLVVVSSLAGKIATPISSSYSGTKFALVSPSKSPSASLHFTSITYYSMDTSMLFAQKWTSSVSRSCWLALDPWTPPSRSAC